jgi:hypothetical protein
MISGSHTRVNDSRKRLKETCGSSSGWDMADR